MRIDPGKPAVQRTFVFAIPVVAAAWMLTVPAVLTTSTFLAALGLLAAFAWIARTTVANGQPVASLAQSLHDADHQGSLEHPRRDR